MSSVANFVRFGDLLDRIGKVAERGTASAVIIDNTGSICRDPQNNANTMSC